MAKWIHDWQEGQETRSIPCREVHTTHVESHNSVSGNPIFRAQLEVPWSLVQLAITRLLGRPEIWPYPTVLRNIIATSVELSNDQSRYSTDQNLQLINYSGNALLDVTYTPRPGVYMQLFKLEDDEGEIDPGASPQDTYWEDSVEPLFESRTQNPELFIWGDSTGSPLQVGDSLRRPLTGNEVPSLPRTDTKRLIHTIEGWADTSSYVDTLVGTVNNALYFSIPLRRTFAVGTLLLDSYSIVRGFTFRSYRNVAIPPPETTYYDPSGFATGILKLVYVHKPSGWEKFWRNVPNGQKSDYHYIHHNVNPFDTYRPFPLADHSGVLQGFEIDLT